MKVSKLAIGKGGRNMRDWRLCLVMYCIMHDWTGYPCITQYVNQSLQLCWLSQSRPSLLCSYSHTYKL